MDRVCVIEPRSLFQDAVDVVERLSDDELGATAQGQGALRLVGGQCRGDQLLALVVIQRARLKGPERGCSAQQLVPQRPGLQPVELDGLTLGQRLGQTAQVDAQAAIEQEFRAVTQVVGELRERHLGGRVLLGLERLDLGHTGLDDRLRSGHDVGVEEGAGAYGRPRVSRAACDKRRTVSACSDERVDQLVDGHTRGQGLTPARLVRCPRHEDVVACPENGLRERKAVERLGRVPRGRVGRLARCPGQRPLDPRKAAGVHADQRDEGVRRHALRRERLHRHGALSAPSRVNRQLEARSEELCDRLTRHQGAVR